MDPERDLVVDGGACAIGVESTIVDCTATPPRVLRLGAISQEQIDAVLAPGGARAGAAGARARGEGPSRRRPPTPVAVSGDPRGALRPEAEVLLVELGTRVRPTWWRSPCAAAGRPTARRASFGRPERDPSG